MQLFLGWCVGCSAGERFGWEAECVWFVNCDVSVHNVIYMNRRLFVLTFQCKDSCVYLIQHLIIWCISVIFICSETQLNTIFLCSAISGFLISMSTVKCQCHIALMVWATGSCMLLSSAVWLLIPILQKAIAEILVIVYKSRWSNEINFIA